MNKINIEEMKRYLKRSLKKKVKITTSLIVLFMMSNSIVSMANYITIDNGKIGEGSKTDYSPGAIALNPKGEGDSKPQKEKIGNYSIAIGLGAEAASSDSVSIGHNANSESSSSVSIGKDANTKMENSVAIGAGSKVYNFESDKGTGGSGQGVAVGSNARAVAQATSLGNDTYAIGHSSIAIGSDDIDIYYNDRISKYDYENYFKKLYDKIDNKTAEDIAKGKGPKYGFTNIDGKISMWETVKYSPTLAQGKGAIAIGSRSIAYENGTTALGTLAFALKEKSTALGTHTRAEGVGAIAIGNDTKVFSDNSVGAGNNIQILKKGGMGFGYDIISGGENSISIGTKVYSNVKTNSLDKGIHERYQKAKNEFIFGNTYIQDNLDQLDDTLGKRENSDNLQNKYSFDILKKEHNGVANVGENNDSKNAITIGTSSMALSENSVGIGHGTFSTAKNSMALGSYSYVNGENSLGLGVYSKVFSKNSIAIGTGSGVAYNADNSLVMGVASYSKGMNGLVFGNKAKVEKENGSAIGNETQVTLSNSMALGHKSKTDYTKEELEKDAYAPKGVLSMPSTENIGVISVGSKGAERRVVNVAAGYRDTDAVNVSQLKAMEEKINQSGLMDVEDDDLNISDNGIHYLSVDKNGYRSKDIKEIMQKQRDYNKYIEYKSRQLEMKAREARGDQLPDSYKTKINAKVENLEKKYENDTQFNQIELKKITDQEIEKIKNNGVSFDSIITKINLAKEKDKYITYTDENGQEIQKLKTILYEDEVKKINESNYNNKGAIGKDSIALGYQTKSTGDKGIAIGTGDQRSLDILENQKIIDITRGEEKQKLVNKEIKLNNNMYTRSGENAVAVGTGAIAKDWSVALGGNTQTEDTAVAIGDRSKALGNRSIAIGNKAATGRYYEFNGKEKINETLKKLNGQTLNYDSIGMVGYDGAEKAIAIGSHSTATSDYSVAIGNGATTGDDKNTKEIYVKDRTKNDLTESEQAMIIRKHFHKDENNFNQDEKNRLQLLIKDYESKNLDRQKQEILEKNYYLKENEVNKDEKKKKIFDELVRSINAKTEQEKKDAKEKILQKYFHKKEDELTQNEKKEFNRKIALVEADNKEMILQKYFAKSNYDQLSESEKKEFNKLIKDLTDSEKENLLRTYFMGKKEEELTPAEKKEFNDFKDKFKKKVKIGGAENAIAIGKYAKASKNDTIALGKDSNAVGEKAIAIGKESKANGSQSVVIGTPNSSNNKTDENTDSNIGEISAGTSSVSVGNGVKSGNYSVGIGGNVVAGYTAVAIGDRSRAIGDTSVAIGEKALAKGPRSIAIGNETKANAEDSYIFGGKSEISQTASQSSAIGINITVKSAQAIAMGNDVLIDENSRGAVAIGSDDSSYNEGNNKIGGNYTKTIAKGNATTAIGAHAQATNVAATALGARAFATEKETVAVGANSKASVEGAVAIGSYSVADQQKNTTYYNPKTGNTDGKVTDKLATKAALSIGDANHQVTRQIIGLAAGTNDTDAVNVWQLKELKGYFDENKKFKLEGDKNGEQTLELPNKLEVKGNTEKKNDGKTYQDWDSTYTVENVQTHISKSGNNAKILIGIKNKPRFDKVYVGNETTGLEIAQDNNNNITLKQNGATLTLTKDNNNLKISGLANGVTDNDAVAYGQVKKPFKVVADSNAAGVDQALGEKFEITGRKKEANKEDTFDAWDVKNNNTKKGRYTTENIETYVNSTNDGTKVLIGLREDPTFKEVKLSNSGKNVKFGIDNNGNATLTDARNNTASPIVTENTLGDQKIKYTAINGNNTTAPKKETTLTNGFNFSDGTNTAAEVGENGVVKFNLKDKLTGITSIEKGDNKAKITLNDDNITVNTKITGLTDGTISASSTDAVNGKQLNTVKTTADEAKSTADTVSGKITALEGKKLGFTGNSGNKIEKKLGEDIAIEGDDSSITTEAKNNAITIKVKDKGITSAKIADKAVGTTQLDDKVVTKDKIADKNITEDKLAEGLLTKINAGNTVATNTITLSGDKGSDNNPTKTSAVSLNENGGIEFSITGKDGLKTTASGTKVEIGMTGDLKNKIDKLDNLADNAENTYATKSELDNKADKKLSNITVEGKKVIKGLIKVSSDTDTDNIATVTGGTNTDDENAKDYKISVKKSKVQEIAKDAVEVTSDNGSGITVTPDKKTDANKTTYKLSLDGAKIKELAGTTNIATEYAKIDGTNLTNLDDIKKKAWATGIGASSIADTTKDELVTDSAVKTYVDGKVLKFAGNTGSESEVSLGNKLSIVGEGDKTPTETAENNITVDSDKTTKKLTVKLAKDLQNIGSVTFKQGDKTSKINIDDSGDLNITKNGNAEKILTTNNIGNQEISYKSNLDNVSKKTTLTTGFDFTSTDLKIETGDNGKVTFNLTDTVKNSLNGKGNDGRDGKSGTDGAGSKGLTGKDGLNGKDITTKVNALRNGEAGTVVYTDKDGNRLAKANDGKYYKAEYVEDNGNLKTGHSSTDEVKDILATLVNPDGSTAKPTTKLRVADGSISAGSKDAINGGQLNNLGYMLGLEVNEKNTGFKAPKITDLKGTNTTPANILDGLNQTREQMNKGLTFEANYNADPYGTSNINKMLGGTLSITASGAENGKYAGTNNANYTGTNLATYVRTDTDGKKKFYIGMKETPTFKSINIGSTGFGDHQTDTGKGDITVDNEGLKLSYDKASITISKDGDKAKLSGLKDANIDENTYGTAGVAATQKEVKDYVAKEITKVNDSQSKLKNGTLGTVVYTDKDGNKLMKDIDGKFYKAQADGTKEENAKEVVPEDVILSTVKPDGKTTEPITLGNVASALGLSNDNKKNGEILKKLVNKEAKKDVYKDAELNKVVTLRDLQFLASKGITFAGSVGTANKYLGDTITINGTASNYNGLDNNNFATKYETKNIAVKVDNNTGNIEVGLAKELKAIESIENKETKVTLTENGTEFKTGADGVTTKIGKDGIEITKQGDEEKNPSVSIKAGDTTNGPSIDFATKEEGEGNDKKTVGTGSITGLKDLADDSDGHMAANKNYVDEKVKTITGDIDKLKNKGLKFAGNTGETKELNDKVNIKGEGTIDNKFESAEGNINVKANDSGVELQLAANLKNMKSFEAKDDKGNTVNITGDKIEFKKNNKSTLTINSDGTITGLKTNSSPFEYYEKNKDTVFAKDGTEYKAGTIVTEDGKVYAKGTQEVEGKYFAEGDKVVKAKDGKFYKEKDIKDRTYDEATKKWSGDSAQPTEATEAKALEGNDLKNAKAEDKVVVKGKDNKFYEASDFEKAEYDEAKNEYTKDGKKLEGKEAKDVVIKALPNNEAMTLSNIANARLVKDSKDAVNAGQMLEELDKKMNKDGSNIDKKEFANNISEGANITKPEGILVTDKQVNEHLNKNYYNKTEVDAKVSNISNTVVEANKKSDLALGGVANAVAMANLLQANSYSKYKTNISAAYGYYGGSNALAIGFSGVSENRMVSYRVSGSVNTKGNIALGAGLGVMLGEFKTDKYPEKGKKISELEEKLRLQTEKTNKLEKQLEEILKLLKK